MNRLWTDGIWTQFPVSGGPKKGVLTEFRRFLPYTVDSGAVRNDSGSRPARRASPTSGRTISGSGLGAPPNLSGRISALLVDSERPVRRVYSRHVAGGGFHPRKL